MPEHIHLLISEPRVGTPTTVMQVLKQRVSRAMRRRKRVAPGQLRLWEDSNESVNTVTRSQFKARMKFEGAPCPNLGRFRLTPKCVLTLFTSYGTIPNELST